MRSSLLRKATKTVLLPPGVLRGSQEGDVVILLYHRVGNGTAEIELPAQAFEQQMRFLSERRKLLTIDQALESSEGGVVVTFDDGSKDFFDRVLPVLVTHEVPATLYLTTGSVTNGIESATSLTWNQLASARSSGLVTVGAHTHTHADLSHADEATAEDEMRRSKELIEDKLGDECRHFAYPWAVGSSAADRVARRLFQSAALDVWKTNRRRALDPHRLGRVPILKSDGQTFFRAKTRGFLDTEAIAYRALKRGPWRG